MLTTRFLLCAVQRYRRGFFSRETEEGSPHDLSRQAKKRREKRGGGKRLSPGPRDSGLALGSPRPSARPPRPSSATRAGEAKKNLGFPFPSRYASPSLSRPGGPCGSRQPRLAARPSFADPRLSLGSRTCAVDEKSRFAKQRARALRFSVCQEERGGRDRERRTPTTTRSADLA